MSDPSNDTRPTLIPRFVRVITTPRTVFWEVRTISEGGFWILLVWLLLEYFVQRPLEWLNATALAQRSILSAALKLGQSYLEYGLVPILALLGAGVLFFVIARFVAQERLKPLTTASVMAFAWTPHVLVVLLVALLRAIPINHPILEAIARGSLSGSEQVVPLAVAIEFGPVLAWLGLAMQTLFATEPTLGSWGKWYPRVVGIVLLCLVVSTLGFVGYRTIQVWDKDRPLMIEDTVDPLEAKRLSGGVVRYAWNNRVSVLDFWSSEDKDYVNGLDERDKLQRAYERYGLQVLALNVGDSADTVRKTIAGRQFQMAILLDPTGKIKKRFEVNQLPSTFLIDVNGRLRDVCVGSYPIKKLNTVVRKLLAEKSSSK